MSQLAERREYTQNRIQQLRAELDSAATLLDSKACVYATGSFGRGEASRYSDLDLFILGKNQGSERESKGESLLSRLDETCVKADLIRATRKLSIRDFDGDGRYLAHYSADQLTQTLGKPDDDSTNTFTARVLLLLESRPLLGDEIYRELTDKVVEQYWRDYAGHESAFVPAFLANDILRMWRTFCVNYEAGTKRMPPDQKAKGKLKNLKLKHSRLLTCFSALLYLLALYGQSKTVKPEDIRIMIALTPTQRLEWLRDQSTLSHARAEVVRALELYGAFLEQTNADEGTLIKRFADRHASNELQNNAFDFGDAIYDALTKIGNNSRLHRLLVV